MCIIFAIIMLPAFWYCIFTDHRYSIFQKENEKKKTKNIIKTQKYFKHKKMEGAFSMGENNLIEIV